QHRARGARLVTPPSAPAADGARHPGKGYGPVRRQERAVFELVNANQADYPVRTMCRVLKVSHSGFYCAWRDRSPSKRTIADAVLTERIRQIHAASDGIYGRPNIHAELRDEGTRVGRKRVA